MPFSGMNGWQLMSESFLHLARKDRSQIYRSLAPRLSRSPNILEKDVWVCWVLQALFTMPHRHRMAFKGGTSLSKVYGAIARFSEDVDITLDYRGLDEAFDPFAEGVSRSQLKKFSDSLKSFVRAHVHDVVAPYFQKRLADEFRTGEYRLDLSSDGEQLRIHYPTVLGLSEDYVGNSILIEFGGRNITEPSEAHVVRPDIAEHVDELVFPEVTVDVLSPKRTFWEKATLIHVACQRGAFGTAAQRLSRHWYDLARLADTEYGRAAVLDRAMLADVVRHKKIFYNASYANYDACLLGQLKLIPQDDAFIALRGDFQRMIDAGMFIGEPPSFDIIIDRLGVLETSING